MDFWSKKIDLSSRDSGLGASGTEDVLELKGSQETQKNHHSDSSWLSGVKVFFSSAYAFVKFGASRKQSIPSEDSNDMFSSLRNGMSSFSLSSWIPKGISISFFEKNKNSNDLWDRSSFVSRSSGPNMLEKIAVLTGQSNTSREDIKNISSSEKDVLNVTPFNPNEIV